MLNRTFFGRLLAAFRLRSSEPDYDASEFDGISHDTALPRSGPQVNLDGTPMLNDALDVMGKPYGDAGAMFSGTYSGGMSDTGTRSTDW